jgi:hypothetical protein
MITRRYLLLLLGYFGFMKVSTHAEMLEPASPLFTEMKDESPPHSDALSLVWSSQREQIRMLEIQHAKMEQSKQKEYVSPESRWWFDTDDRCWEVSRPIGLGRIDSTHLFRVKYVINGKVLLTWDIDTREKRVGVIK